MTVLARTVVAAGAAGLTPLDSRSWAMGGRRSDRRDGLPLVPSVRVTMRGREEASRAQFSVVADDFEVDIVVSAPERVLRPLTDPDSGIPFFVPVRRARLACNPATGGFGRGRRRRLRPARPGWWVGSRWKT